MPDMRFTDFIFSGKTTQILDAVMRITSWMSGLDKRLNVIERRLGAMEMALTMAGIKIQPVATPEEKNPGGTVSGT